MDNREAMIAAFNMSYANPWNDEFHQLEIDLTVLNDDEQKTFFKQRNFQQGWQAATAHNRDAVIDLLEKVEAALKLSQSICDAVPTMAHHSEDSAMSDLGRLVNLQEDGTHGYATIRETESAVSEFLESLRSLKANKEG